MGSKASRIARLQVAKPAAASSPTPPGRGVGAAGDRGAKPLGAFAPFPTIKVKEHVTTGHAAEGTPLAPPEAIGRVREGEKGQEQGQRQGQGQGGPLINEQNLEWWVENDEGLREMFERPRGPSPPPPPKPVDR